MSDSGERLSSAKLELLARWRAGAFAPPVDDLAKGTIEPRVWPGSEDPATRGQRTHWGYRDPATDTSNWVIGFFGVVDTVIDTELFGRAVAEVARRQEILRTTLDEVDGGVVQGVHDEPLVELTVTDLTEHGPSAEADALQVAQDVRARPADLRRGPLVRVGLYTLPGAVTGLSIIVHHAAGDGWSLGVAIAELVLDRSPYPARDRTVVGGGRVPHPLEQVGGEPHRHEDAE